MGRTESPNLKTITSEPVVGTAISTRAKWRSSPSARIGMLKSCLTPPTLSETRCFNSYEGFSLLDSPIEPLLRKTAATIRATPMSVMAPEKRIANTPSNATPRLREGGTGCVKVGTHGRSARAIKTTPETIKPRNSLLVGIVWCVPHSHRIITIILAIGR